ncbi:ankyrin repeat and zinc finger domain-containing protein 1 isoform X4 [Neltuma alba]|uniref:ankyrin repeat and zinc finger domain-containing protein 1 isoform X4 n=1 Tax=Neltuma alba TaxID=207710 RepID=UPI0010A431E0|nr:ankyrin repeat and zinc finger domain-containing protein 1 isoform X4 [Prosopis alba]
MIFLLRVNQGRRPRIPWRSDTVLYSNSSLNFFTPVASLLPLDCPLPTIFRIATTQFTKPLTLLRRTLMASKTSFFQCPDGLAILARLNLTPFKTSVCISNRMFIVSIYVVRAKAGKKQSTKDATGRAAHSAGASLRRHNELALRKEIQELLTGWRAYFDASNCIFVHDPSSSRQLLFDGERPYFSNQHNVTRSIPLTVRRPTLREAKRVYSQLTQVSYEVEEDLGSTPITVRNANPAVDKEAFTNSDSQDKSEACSSKQDDSELLISSASESENGIMGKSTPLHQAVQSGDSHKVLKLLEQGIDPCIKDERGRTPYMLAHDKEVRNTFRRFMASNPEKWDWRAAKVPSALTKEMEESQAAKQAEKDAKRKARAKELKKLRKAKEKRAQAEAAKNASKTAENEVNAVTSTQKLSKEEELRRAQAEEREKRAGAAERRLAALKIQGSSATTVLSTSEPKGGAAGDIYCSCCNMSLAGKVPFHRYNYKYCSSSCMHVHREILEDG